LTVVDQAKKDVTALVANDLLKGAIS